MTTPTIFKQRLLDVARAVRETNIPVTFYRHLNGLGLDLNPNYAPLSPDHASVLGQYAARADLQSDWLIDPRGRIKRFRKFRDGTEAWYPLSEMYMDEAEYFGLSEEDDSEFNVAYIFADGDGDERVLGGAKTVNEAADYIEAFAERKWPEA